MKWRYKTSSDKYDRLSKWHLWFAWHPVFDNGKGYWLCWIERRCDSIFLSMGVYTSWYYREIGTEDNNGN